MKTKAEVDKAVRDDMAKAHAEGWHSPPEIPREFCPECEAAHRKNGAPR